MATVEKARFFDELAVSWDERHDLRALAIQLRAGLEELGVGADETVLDVGCGTGNLTRALLDWLSPRGRVIAIDVAPAMIDRARRKCADDPRLELHVADAAELPLPARCCDRVICCSVWPHLDNPRAAAGDLHRVLREGGRIDVWHLAPRARINHVHTSGGPAIERDLLVPGVETARVLADAGFRTTRVVDDDSRYLVTAVKAAP